MKGDILAFYFFKNIERPMPIDAAFTVYLNQYCYLVEDGQTALLHFTMARDKSLKGKLIFRTKAIRFSLPFVL